jgi:hypothetical protein
MPRPSSTRTQAGCSIIQGSIRTRRCCWSRSAISSG